MSDFEQMVQYWDNTGEWRKSYYTQLKNITSDKLSMAEKMERELDLAEYTAIDKIIKYKKKISLLDIGCGVGIKSVYLIATRDLSNLWLQFFLSQNQGFMRLFEKTVLK